MCVCIHTYKYAYIKKKYIKINELRSQTLILEKDKTCVEK